MDKQPLLKQYCNEALRSAGFSAHAEYVFWHGMPAVYEYDPADDGPECEIITRILGAFPYLFPDTARRLRALKAESL